MCQLQIFQLPGKGYCSTHETYAQDTGQCYDSFLLFSYLCLEFISSIGLALQCTDLIELCPDLRLQRHGVMVLTCVGESMPEALPICRCPTHHHAVK